MDLQFDLSRFATSGLSVSLAAWVPALCQALPWAPLRAVNWKEALAAPTDQLARL